MLTSFSYLVSFRGLHLLRHDGREELEIRFRRWVFLEGTPSSSSPLPFLPPFEVQSSLTLVVVWGTGDFAGKDLVRRLQLSVHHHVPSFPEEEFWEVDD